MAKYYTILTEAGTAKVANATVTNTKVNITQVAVGDASGTTYNPTGKEMSLKRETWRGSVTSIEPDENNPNWVVVEASIPSAVGGFTLREVGLFDDTGALIAIGNYPDTYKPVLADGTVMDLILNTVINVENADSVTTTLDPTVVIASRKYVADQITPISEQLAQKEQQINNLTQLNRYTDNRNVNSPPSHYYGRGAGVYREFKLLNTINLPTSIAGSTNYPYLPIDTVVPYGDVTGGLLTQYAHAINGVTAVRKNLNNNDWSDWYYLLNSRDLSSSIDSTSDKTIATSLAVRTLKNVVDKKYEKPTNGIPKSDLSNDILSTLNELTQINRYTDNRTVNSPPSYYYGKGSGVYKEFKLLTTVGISTALVGNTNYPYLAIDTIVPYGDVTGGLLTQLAYANNGVTLVRKNLNNNDWGDWYYLLNSRDLSSSIDSTSDKTIATSLAVRTLKNVVDKKYEKPTNGIPKSDLSNDILSALNNNKAYTLDFERATNLAGEQIIDVGFIPKFVRIEARLASSANEKYYSSGTFAAGKQIVMTYLVNNYTQYQSYNGAVVRLHSGNTYNMATCRVNTDNTITLNWSIYGTIPTDTIIFKVEAM